MLERIYLLSEMTAGAILVDMNGRTVRLWDKLRGFHKNAARRLHFRSSFDRSMEFGFQDGAELLQIDWEGNIVWEFSKNEYIEDPGQLPDGWPEIIMTSSGKAILSAIMRPDRCLW